MKRRMYGWCHTSANVKLPPHAQFCVFFLLSPCRGGALKQIATSLWTAVDVRTGSIWTLLNRMHKSIESKVGTGRPSPSSLRPPPLFRSIGPPGSSAGLPPHRRLRSLFCRSRAVLPADTHPTELSDTRIFTNIQTDSHARRIMCPLGFTDALSEDITVLNELQHGVDSDLQGRAVFRSGLFAGTAQESLQVQYGQQGRQLFSHICPSARSSGRSRGRQGRLVTPLQTSEDPAAFKEKQRQKRRKRSYRVDCAGQQKYVVPLPSLTEREDAKLCEWLQSLGIADSCEKSSITTNNQQRLFVSRCRGLTGQRETAASHRRDRRPHFLPPICQSTSLLHVPLLLPENSPPPSPCSHPDAPSLSLPIPLLRPFSSRTKSGAVGQPKKGARWLPQGCRLWLCTDFCLVMFSLALVWFLWAY